MKLTLCRIDIEMKNHSCQCSASPSIWNAIPLSLRVARSIGTFKSHLKSFYLATVRTSDSSFASLLRVINLCMYVCMYACMFSIFLSYLVCCPKFFLSLRKFFLIFALDAL